MTLRDLCRERHIANRPGTQPPPLPGVASTRRDPEDATHCRDREDDLVIPHEPEAPFEELGIVPASRANRAAACERMSRSCFKRRFSRRSFCSSARSLLVRPSVRAPRSRAAGCTQFRIVWPDGSHSRDNSSGVRPPSTSDQLLTQIGGIHMLLLATFGIGMPPAPQGEVSTKPGQLQKKALDGAR